MHVPRWSYPRTMVVAAAILLLPTAHTAFAQSPSAKPSATAAAPTDEELNDTRAQLLALLRVSPTLTHVMETDPSLLADPEYISRTNPQLAQFLALHPEVTRNPDFYLFANFPKERGKRVEGLRRRGDEEPPSDEQMQRETRRQEFQDVTVAFSFIGIAGALIWLVRIFLENRRWSRVFRQQSEIHTKLIDRFASNQDLLHYMETDPGKRFLEAAPIPIGFDRDQRMPGGFGRVLASLQIGIVMTLLGIGLLSLEHRLPDIADPLLVFGMIAMMPGIGFIISALITWRMSVRLGLMPRGPQASTELTDRQ